MEMYGPAISFSLHGFPNKTTNVSNVAKSQENLRLKSNNLAQSSKSQFSTTCISQSVEGQSPWIIDSSISDHIFGNTSLFSSLFFPNNPHFITLAISSKISSKGVPQVSLSPSLNLKYVIFVPWYPFNLISLSQLAKSLNWSITFKVTQFKWQLFCLLRPWLQSLTFQLHSELLSIFTFFLNKIKNQFG